VNVPVNDRAFGLPADAQRDYPKSSRARLDPAKISIHPNVAGKRSKLSFEPLQPLHRRQRRRDVRLTLQSKRTSKSYSWTKYSFAAMLCLMIFPTQEKLGAWHAEARERLSQVVPYFAEPKGLKTPSIPETDIAQRVITQTIPLNVGAIPAERLSSDLPKILRVQNSATADVENQMKASFSSSKALDFEMLKPSETLMPTPDLIQSVEALGSSLSIDAYVLGPSFNPPSELFDVKFNRAKLEDRKPTARFVQTLIPNVIGRETASSSQSQADPSTRVLSGRFGTRSDIVDGQILMGQGPAPSQRIKDKPFAINRR